MSDIAIKVENLSKMYRLGEIGTGSLGTDITSWWAKVRGKEDPFSMIAIANDRSQKASSDFVWSLKDLNFEIKKGDALGIIGKNGAGKSTLLKILSRTTSPTTGNIKINGRIASLLEVGTGFHGDLSGKENIYMNGAILGMTRKEITSKLEEIIEFSGVSGYIDTPVKRYSSGMYVRLAFSVAAHLDPDIMIVDEVLAVGDNDFQKKCLNKMQSVNNEEGRTVIFVSHNMLAIRQLCTRSIVLKNGELIFSGNVNEGVKKYLENVAVSDHCEAILEPSNNEITFTRIAVLNSLKNVASSLNFNETFYIELEFKINRILTGAEISLCFRNSLDVNVLFTSLGDKLNGELVDLYPGNYKVQVEIKGNFLFPDTYYLKVISHYRNNSNIEEHDDVVKFTIIDTGSAMFPYGSSANQVTCVLGGTTWNILSKD